MGILRMPVPLPIIRLVLAKGSPGHGATKPKSLVNPEDLGAWPPVHPVCHQLGILCLWLSFLFGCQSGPPWPSSPSNLIPPRAQQPKRWDWTEKSPPSLQNENERGQPGGKNQVPHSGNGLTCLLLVVSNWLSTFSILGRVQMIVQNVLWRKAPPSTPLANFLPRA